MGISLPTMVLTLYHNYVLTNGFAIIGGVSGLVFVAVIFIVGVALLMYSRSLAHKGVLR